MLDGVDIGLGELALEQIDLGGADGRALALGDQLDALAGGVGALVELAGEELDGERLGGIGLGQLGKDAVHLRLGEHRGDAALEQIAVDTLDVVAVDDAEAGKRLHTQDVAQLAQQLLSLYIEPGFLLYVYARNH